MNAEDLCKKMQEEKKSDGENYYERIEQYFNYASNATINGVCTVDKNLAELLALVHGSNTKRTEGKNLLAAAALIFKPCLGVHDVADNLAVKLKHKCKLWDEIGVVSHHVNVIMLVRTGLIDIPKRLTGKFFYGSVILFCF